jgi:hypothetical protein
LKPETIKSVRSGFLDRNKNITARRDEPARCSGYQWASFDAAFTTT